MGEKGGGIFVSFLSVRMRVSVEFDTVEYYLLEQLVGKVCYILYVKIRMVHVGQKGLDLLVTNAGTSTRLNFALPKHDTSLPISERIL